jgi:hypothetical protein
MIGLQPVELEKVPQHLPAHSCRDLQQPRLPTWPAWHVEPKLLYFDPDSFRVTTADQPLRPR